MRSFRFLPPVFAAATLLLLGANALPTSVRKHRLESVRLHLERRLVAERGRAELLSAQIAGVKGDRFVLQRWVMEAWSGTPEGAKPWPSMPSAVAEEITQDELP